MMNKQILSVLIGLVLALCACSKPSEPSVEQKKSLDREQIKISNISQSDIDNIAQSLDVTYQVVTNIPSEKCDKNIADGACFEAQITFTAHEDILAKNWHIFFSQIAPIQSFESEEFKVEHINGDLHKITLADNFTGFKAGASKTLKFRAMFWSLSEYDAMPNYIVMADNLTAKVIESTRPVIDSETGLEILPFVASFTDNEKQFKRTANDATQWLTAEALYQRNAKLQLAANPNIQESIIPTPKSAVFHPKKAELELANGLAINLINVDKTFVQAALNRIESLGLKLSETGVPVFVKVVANEARKIGSYQLDIEAEKITVVGVDANGAFNGLQTIASLVTVGSNKLPLVTIEDEPHYDFRGILVDVARNFHSKAFILKLLDQMAAYKLNKLHLHLGDDEGWRLEIPSLPELTEIGGKRCFDPQESHCLIAQLGAGTDENSEVNGFYSVADYQEILKAASARHIQVIPSLDMPGHARAAIKAMTARYNKYMAQEDKEKAQQFLLHDPEDTTKYSSVQFYSDNTINVCLESSYDFITEVMMQVKQIHQAAGQPLTRYHIGADETAGAWVNSPACLDFLANNDKNITVANQLSPYFVERVAAILADLGIEAAAWSDGLEHTRKENMPAIVQANAWGHLPWQSHQKTHELANRNWQVVVSTPDALYFDFPYEADPKEHGYYWASRHTNTEKIFQFMPDNLPVHAEFWLDRQDNPFEADDTFVKNDQGELVSQPLTQDRKFLGIQGQLWSENTRSDKMAEHKIFPRLFALAERAWYQASWAVPYNYQGFKYSENTNVFDEKRRQIRDREWQLFANVIGKKELVKLEHSNIAYRLPTVGAVIKQGKLYANVAFPGLSIEYKTEGQPWKIYQGPVAVSSDVSIRSVSFDSKRRSRTIKARFPVTK